MGIHEQSSVQTFPIAGRNWPFGDGLEGALWTIRAQDLRAPADTLGLEAGEHIITSAIKMDFRRPEISVSPEVRGRPKRRERPFPVLQIATDIIINTRCRVCPTFRASRAIKIILLLRYDRQHEWVTDMEIAGFQYESLRDDGNGWLVFSGHSVYLDLPFFIQSDVTITDCLPNFPQRLPIHTWRFWFHCN